MSIKFAPCLHQIWRWIWCFLSTSSQIAPLEGAVPAYIFSIIWIYCKFCVNYCTGIKVKFVFSWGAVLTLYIYFWFSLSIFSLLLLIAIVVDPSLSQYIDSFTSFLQWVISIQSKGYPYFICPLYLSYLTKIIGLWEIDIFCIHGLK